MPFDGTPPAVVSPVVTLLQDGLALINRPDGHYRGAFTNGHGVCALGAIGIEQFGVPVSIAQIRASGYLHAVATRRGFGNIMHLNDYSTIESVQSAFREAIALAKREAA